MIPIAMLRQKRPHSPESDAYRPDIDGLRALAIIAVIIFHAFPMWLRGGFVGVDVFFVISGFLITGIILDRLNTNQFGFRAFYAARIRRIFPALLFILIASLVAGWCILLANEYQLLGKHVAGGAGFVTNFLLWQESGYFDPASESKPLLHLWSLGIEEQFYLLWPALLWITYRLRWPVIGLVAVVGIGSFVANMSLAEYYGVADFYSPVARFWELMAGGALASYQTRKRSSQFDLQKMLWLPDILSVCGFLLIITSVAGFNRNMAFPSWRALLPVTGTACLIIAGPTALINRTILSRRIMVGIGLISYPLYLWHWPLLTFAHIFEDIRLPHPLRLAVLAASVLMAWLTYRFVEKPIRFGKHRTSVIILLCLAMIGVGSCGYAVYVQEGVTSRGVVQASKLFYYNVETRRTIIAGELAAKPCDFDASILPKKIKDYCTQFGNNDAKKTIVVWGDSHADSWSLAIFRLAQKMRDTRVVMISHRGCPPLIGIRRTAQADGQEQCRDLSQGATIVETIRKLKPDQIFLIARWSLYTKGQRYANGGLQPDYRQITTFPTDAETPSDYDAMGATLRPTLEALSSIAKLLIIKNVPVLLGDVNGAVAAQATTQNVEAIARVEPTLEQHQALSEHAYQMIDDIVATLPNVQVFDPAPLLCSDTCKAIKDGTVMYRDDAHPSTDGVLQLEPYLESLLKIPASKSSMTDPLTSTPCAFDISIMPEKVKKYCTQFGSDTAENTIVLWGDSHTGAWSSLLFRLAKEWGNYRVIVLSHQGCPPLLNVRRSDGLNNSENCKDLTQGAAIVQSIQNLKPDRIMVVSRWSLYTKGWRNQETTLNPATHFITSSADGPATPQTAEDAMRTNLVPTIKALSEIADVLVIKNPPLLMGDIQTALTAQATTHHGDHIAMIEPTLQQHMDWSGFSYRLIDEAAMLPHVRVFDPTPLLCSDTCKAIKDGLIMYEDDNHLSPEGVLLFTPQIKSFLDTTR